LAENALTIYEGEDLTNLKKSTKITDTDMVSFMPNDQSYFTIMSGDKGLSIDLTNPGDIIKRLPGGNPLYDALKKLEWRGNEYEL
jgi:hypothetical protein